MRRRRSPGADLKLAGLVEEVAEDYVSFLRLSRLDADPDPRSFGARHTAAKAALAHIEALIKLAQGEEGTAARTEQALQLGAVRAAIAKEHSDDDEDDRESG